MGQVNSARQSRDGRHLPGIEQQIPVKLIYLEWGLIGVGLAFITLPQVYQSYVLFGLITTLGAFGLRWRRSGHFIPRTGLELPALLFLVSGGIASWLAFDPAPALLQYTRLLAAVVLMYAVVDSPPRVQDWIAIGLVFLAAGLALYWPLQNDFSQAPVKLNLVNQIGLWMNAHLPILPGPGIHNNVAAGTLAVGLPFAVIWAWKLWQKGSKWAACGAAGLGGIILAGLVITSSRGALLGLIGAGWLFLLAAIQRRWFKVRKAKYIFWGGFCVLMILSGWGLVASGGADVLLGQIPDPNQTLAKRSELWKQSIPMIRDNFFSGSGLMSFRMIYAIYGILIHVPVQDHAHNTFLEVWIEQGILGSLALLLAGLIVLCWTWRALDRPRIDPWGLAGVTALIVAGLHGLFDVVFYVTRTLPLIGLLAGFAFLINRAQLELPNREPGPARHWGWVVVIMLVVIGLGLVGLYHRQIIAMGYANLGAVRQARIELRAYNPDTFANPTLDRVRQEADLSGAEEAFNQALTWDGDNLTALQRKSEIALSRGEYDQALAWMQQAWETGARDEVTRLLFADALLAAGRGEEAAEILEEITWAENRLWGQAWYRYWLNQDYARVVQACIAILVLDPGNADAAYLLEQAEKSLAQPEP